MKCPECGFINGLGIKYCGECGARLKQAAVPEGTGASWTDSSPDHTSTGSSGIAGEPVSAHGKAEGQRRQVTAMFVDIKGYTPLSEQLGEEGIFHLMERIYGIMIAAVHEEGGAVQSLTGDGIYALFGAPVAIEEAPYRACRAALAIQKRITIFADGLASKQGIKPMARIGINTGPVVVCTMGTESRMEFTALGDTVNLASRLESIAEPGSIYISEATYNLAAPYIESGYIGQRAIKGKREPQKIYRLTGIRANAGRFDAQVDRGLTPLAGRTRELESIGEYFYAASQSRTILVQITGEPGVGKSRLLYELHKIFSAKKAFYLRANCTAVGRTASFLPFIEIIKTIFRINEGDTRGEVDVKLGLGIVQLGMPLETKPYFLNLLGFTVQDGSLKGLDEKIIGDRTRKALAGLLIKRAAISSMVLAIEDLHWIDSASEELLHRIINEETGAPLLIICTARPQYTAPWPTGGNVLDLRLQPLSRQDTSQMVQAILGSGAEVAADINELIVSKTGGNPFFIEEMVRYILESGRLRRTDLVMLGGPADAGLAVPATLKDLLQARVDRLEEEPRALLQAASVIGQRFSADLAHMASGLGGSFHACLKELERQELVFREPVGNVIEYRFKHALLQDVVYDNLLNPHKEKLHEAAATAIEMLYPDRLAEWSEALARHWGNTGNAGRAAYYTAMAAEKNMKVYALETAYQLFAQAAQIIESNPGCVDEVAWADMMLKWVQLNYLRGDFKGMTTLLEPHLARFEALGDKRRLSHYLAWLGGGHMVQGHGQTAGPILNRAEELALEIDDAECILRVSISTGWLYLYWVPYSEYSDAKVRKYTALALAKAMELNDIFYIQDAYMMYAVYNLQRSRFPEARSYCDKLYAHGRKHHDDRSLAVSQWVLGFCNIYEERYQEALECGEQALKLCRDELSRDGLCALAVKGGALAMLGRVQEGLEIMLKAEREMLKREFIIPLSGLEIPLGAVMALAGHMKKGVDHIEHFINHWAQLGNSWQPVWGHLFLGEIFLELAAGKEKPPLKVILKNAGFIIGNLPSARRKARLHLEEVIRKCKEYGMPGFMAKALYDLGVLEQAGKKHKNARSLFEEALVIAEASRLDIAYKIRLALNLIP
ncbi:MAG: AAA family ATPase [Actinomycetota bacterium]|nr:AAA family ATPase [Actinomycetota bacterium]